MGSFKIHQNKELGLKYLKLVASQSNDPISKKVVILIEEFSVKG